MKALRIVAGDPPRLELSDSPMPEPKAGEALVRVIAAGVNRADLLQLGGHYAVPADAPPDIPGLEFAGVVERLGAHCSGVRVGQRVLGLANGGAHAQYLVSPQELLVKIPETVDDVHAGAVAEAYITAHDALVTQAGLVPEERALVHAVASSVGIAAVQIAAGAGCPAFGTTRTQDKVDELTRLSRPPEHLMPTIHFCSPDTFDREILEHTSGAGVDVILDPVGAAYFERNLAVVAPRGRIVYIGTMGGARVTLELGVLLRRRLRLFGTMLRGRTLEEKAVATRAFERDVLPRIATGSIQPIIDRTFALEQAADAYAWMAANRNTGKIVLTV